MQLESWILQHESTLRLTCFLSVFFLIAIFEWIKPRRIQSAYRPSRWFINLALASISTLAVRLIVPMGLIAIALEIKQQNLGLFNLISLPDWLTLIMALVVLDFSIYWQHRLFHKVPILWRMHKIHHTDRVYDVSTGFRFHPLEIIFSIFIKIFIISIFGIPAIAIIIFEVLLNALAMFNHGNINIPRSIDTPLRRFIVTPDMHRVHHSEISREHNTNFGFNISLWDRLFNSYTAQPFKGHQKIDIGLKEYPNEKRTKDLLLLLKMPFSNDNKDSKY